MKNVKITEKTERKRNAGTIFNPYVKDNHIGIRTQVTDIKAVGVIKGACFWTDNGIHETTKSDRNIYVYKISYEFTGFWMDSWKAELFINKGENDLIRPALLFFEEGVMDCLELEADDKTVCEATIKKAGRIPFYVHSLGSLSNREASEGGSLKEWKVIPRELFDNDRRYVYLFICTNGAQAPVLKGYKFPENRPFFWELPVASSIFDNEDISKSVIIDGIVKEKVIKYSVIMSKPQKDRPDPVFNSANKDIPDGYRIVKGSFSWNKGGKPVKPDPGCVFRNADPSADDYEMIFTRKDTGASYACGSIGINVYNSASFGTANRFNILMWRSGSNDDMIHSDYLGEDHQNKYPYLLNSISVGAVYGSLADIRVISPESAGYYLSRHLARQPKGNRSISIEGAIEKLFGGPLYRVEEIVTDGNVKKLAFLKQDDPEYDKNKETRARYREYVNELLTINDNYLYYDSPVKTANGARETTGVSTTSGAKEDAYYYVETVLGIHEGSSGAEKAGDILARLFKKIKSCKLTVNYVTSDMELIHCDAGRLATRRFNGAYMALNGYGDNYDKFRKEIYGTQIWNGLKKNSAVLGQLLSKGYYFAGETGLDRAGKVNTGNYYPLSEIAQLNFGAENNKSIYAKSYTKDYKLRRDIGVWDTVMNSYENDLFNKFIFLPVFKVFGSAKCGIYAKSKKQGWISYSTQFEDYLGGNTDMDDKLSSTAVLYGGTGTYGFQRSSMDTWGMYPNRTSVLKMLAESVNSLRSSMAMRSDKTQVYIASPYFLENDALAGTELMERIGKSYSDVPEAINMIYRELLYHIFLHNPEKVYAYFKHPAKMTRGINEFYSGNCAVLNDVLSDLHDIFGNNKTTLITKTLAVVTEPYLLSGSRVGRKNLWRLSFDACGNNVHRFIKKIPDGISFRIGDKTISFPGGKILMGEEKTQYEPCCGYWIETPAAVMPKVLSDNGYYIKNPAYGMKCETPGIYPEEISRGDIMGYKYFNTYTLFGEKHNRLVCSMKFKMTKKIENFAYLLWNGSFAANGMRSQQAFRAVIGETKQNNPLKDTVPFYYMYKNNKLTGASCELETGRFYEIKLTETVDAVSKAMRIAYELWRESDSGAMEQLENAGMEKEFAFHTSDSDNHELLYPYMLYMFMGDASINTIPDRLIIEDFRVYYDDHYEKIEIFRERDGINAGRVKSADNAYKINAINNDFACAPGEGFIGKLTYLNATDSFQMYRLQYLQDGKACAFGRNSIFPADGTVLDPGTYLNVIEEKKLKGGRTFDETGLIIVAPGSEGYVLLDLPDTLLKTEKVTLRLQSLGAPMLGLSDLESHLKQLERIYRIKRTIEVSVEIPGKKTTTVPKNRGG